MKQFFDLGRKEAASFHVCVRACVCVNKGNAPLPPPLPSDFLIRGHLLIFFHLHVLIKLLFRFNGAEVWRVLLEGKCEFKVCKRK